QGKRIIVKESSQPKGKFVLVARTKKVGGKWVEDTKKEGGWIRSKHLEGGWANYKGPYSKWEGGRYTGQTDLVEIAGSRKKVHKLTPEMVNPYSSLRAAAAKANIDLKVSSGFRDYPKQAYLWKNRDKPGIRGPAKPGRSPHQSGRAIDFANMKPGKDGSEYKWMQENACEFGFVRTVSTKNERHHWEFIPDKAKKLKEKTKESKESKKFFGTWKWTKKGNDRPYVKRK
ncbi:MAG: hypothetical protein GY797_03555, partial [Deltaproteobacteria bacterium]|nr:hypothetical protein [Deltaproteobacteria bacterium]